MSVDLLKQSVLFKGFTQVGLAIIAKIVRGRVLLAGNPLFAEGSPSEALYLLVEGRLAISMKSPEGREIPVASLGPGEHLGQMSLLSEGRPVAHLCSATAELDSKVLEISAAEFRALAKEKPQACMKLTLAISQDYGQRVAASGDVLKYMVARTVAR